MRLVALHLDDDAERMKRMKRHAATVGLGLTVFRGVSGPTKSIGIARSFRNLATVALAEGWGLGDVVVQDDIRFRAKPPPATDPLTVYGTRHPNGHVCMRAFAATTEMWELLLAVLDGETKVCHACRPIVDQRGLVLNIVGHPDVSHG